MTENGVFFNLAENSEDVLKANRLRHDVFLKCGYIKIPHEGGVIPDPKNHVSEYILATDLSTGEVVGCVRMTPIEHSEDMFSEWEDLLLEGAQPTIKEIKNSKSVEIGSLAMMSGCNRKIAWGLYKLLIRRSFETSLRYWAIAIDKMALRAVRRAGWLIRPLGEEREYMGSLTILAFLDMREQINYIRSANPAFHAYVTEG